jgi:hypothetical protein
MHPGREKEKGKGSTTKRVGRTGKEETRKRKGFEKKNSLTLFLYLSLSVSSYPNDFCLGVMCVSMF